jgi:hypothetical protein
MTFARELERRIQEEYLARGDSLGWRLLYSPEACLDGARVALVGINPGGDRIPPDHAVFAMPRGSAYEIEVWRSRVQGRVRTLLALLKERAEDVLAGNLVPFRSPTWAALHDRKGALRFGTSIWTPILERARPQLIIAMGREVRKAIKPIVGAYDTRSVALNDGGTVRGERGPCRFGVFVGIPHLSRFAAMGRPGIRELLAELRN